MKTFLEFMKEDFSPSMNAWLKNNQTTQQRLSREPTEIKPDLSPSLEKMRDQVVSDINKRDIRTNVPRTVNTEPVDTIGANSPFSDRDVNSYDTNTLNQPNAAREKVLRQKYQQPPGYKTPDYNKTREKIDVQKSQDLDPGVFPDLSGVPMPGIDASRRANPQQSKPPVPVVSAGTATAGGKVYTSGRFNSALAQAGYDQTGKRVTAIPKQTGVGREKVPLTTNKQNIPSGPGITEPGSAGYTEPVKKKQITDRVPSATDAVVRKKQFNDRVLQVEPPKSQTAKSRGMGPFTISKDDPGSIRYKEVARLNPYAPRTRTKLDKDGTIPAAAQPDKTKKIVRLKNKNQNAGAQPQPGTSTVKRKKVVTQTQSKSQQYGPITSFIKSLASPSKRTSKTKFDNRFDPERNK